MTALDQALAQPPDDPAQMPAYVAERITPALSSIRANLPDHEVASDVEAVLAAVEDAAETGDDTAFDSPAFARAQAAVYPYVAEACDYQKLDVTAVDYAYEGVPARARPGRTVLVLRNESEAGEFHEMALVKLRPEATLPVAELVALPDDQAEALIDPASYGIGAYAGPGEVGGSVIDLTPGRWVYACFIPVGTTDPAVEGTGPPHAAEGMYGELVVG
jgi:hypothetical protein